MTVLLAALALHYLALKTLAMARYALSRLQLQFNLADLVAVMASLLIVWLAKWHYSKMNQRSWHTDTAANALAGVLMLQWLAFCLHHPVEELFRGHLHIDGNELILAIVALVFLTLAYWRLSNSDDELAVIRQAEAPAVDGIILFLSYWWKPSKEQPVAYLKSENGELTETAEWKAITRRLLPENGSIRESDDWEWLKKESWWMPVVAIDYQLKLGKLRKLIVIGSANSMSPGDGSFNGSAAQFGVFRKLIATLYGDAFKIEILDEAGIDFEDCDQISKAVQRARHRLRTEDITDYVIDVTGGTKITTVIGAALTLQVGQQFQYVSTNSPNSLGVKAFDLRYERHEDFPG